MEWSPYFVDSAVWFQVMMTKKVHEFLIVTFREVKQSQEGLVAACNLKSPPDDTLHLVPVQISVQKRVLNHLGKRSVIVYHLPVGFLRYPARMQLWCQLSALSCLPDLRREIFREDFPLSSLVNQALVTTCFNSRTFPGQW